MRSLMLIVASVVSPGNQPPPMQASGDGQVVIGRRLTPANLVESVTGSCGPDSYRIELRHRGERTSLSIQVNGRLVPASELAKATTAVPRGYFMYQPFVAQCFSDRPNARMRILVAGPANHGRAQWLSFEVNPVGKITDVRAD